MSEPLLAVRNLSVSYHGPDGVARALDDVSLAVEREEIVALVGESGSGKTTLALALLGLLPEPAAIAPSSRIEFAGISLANADAATWRRVRGREIGMVFQDPAVSLNPVLTIGSQIAHVVRTHARCSPPTARSRAIELLDMVGVDAPQIRARQYPHQLSGGLRQRALIAVALAGSPKLLVADEPTAALDVTVQAQILQLFADLRRRLGMALLLITHDLGLVAEVAHRVLVMYAGQVVESASVEQLFTRSRHPYTRGLLGAARALEERRHRLAAIPGAPPRASAWPDACRFHPRCALAWERCRTEAPILLSAAPAHHARCWLVAEPAREGA
ncbi:MAG TPA: ABC transporter ATP-binding protein [Gemmatimonadales bacterium]|nr:ABC transporter ATP-binding protein [Gemmatimonadales bacterium]